MPLTCWPLSAWADRQLAGLAAETGSAAIARLKGTELLGERAALHGFTTPGLVSAGGGCYLLPARQGWIALNLARADDHALLPAWLMEPVAYDRPDTILAAMAPLVARADAETLVRRGRDMGLAVARTGETPASPAIDRVMARPGMARPGMTQGHRPPLVLDLSALWAGPLAGHLLWLAGAQVLKIESPRRPDGMRDGDPALFARLNQGKASIALDIATAPGREAFLTLLDRADMVIEAARPRALAHLGIDAAALLAARAAERPLVWLTITGHGIHGQAGDWVGFGDDCSVAGGLTDALIQASGRAGFVGDAIADPLTGITAARTGWQAWREGRNGRLVLAMSGIVALALAEEKQQDSDAFDASGGQGLPPLHPMTVYGSAPSARERQVSVDKAASRRGSVSGAQACDNTPGKGKGMQGGNPLARRRPAGGINKNPSSQITLIQQLRTWDAHKGRPIPAFPPRPLIGDLHGFGADTGAWL